MVIYSYHLQGLLSTVPQLGESHHPCLSIQRKLCTRDLLQPWSKVQFGMHITSSHAPRISLPQNTELRIRLKSCLSDAWEEKFTRLGGKHQQGKRSSRGHFAGPSCGTASSSYVSSFASILKSAKPIFLVNLSLEAGHTPWNLSVRPQPRRFRAPIERRRIRGDCGRVLSCYQMWRHVSIAAYAGEIQV
jgi:hypothetical protein